jgi:hypothetical protein
MSNFILYVVMMILCSLGVAGGLASRDFAGTIWPITCAIWVNTWYRETLRKSPNP